MKHLPPLDLGEHKRSDMMRIWNSVGSAGIRLGPLEKTAQLMLRHQKKRCDPLDASSEAMLFWERRHEQSCSLTNKGV